MANYKEKTKQVRIEGVEKSWRRCRLVTIRNDYAKTPKIEFLEDNVTITADGREIHKGGETLKQYYQTPDSTFDLISPFNGEKLGEGTDGQLHLLLYSKYMSLAKLRDEKLLLKR
jgi:hypothetical protein